MLDLTSLFQQRLSATSKGVPDRLEGARIGEVGDRRLNILRDDFPSPVAVIRDSALRANIALMRQYTESEGVRLAPHGKTTMCPQLFDLQLEAGAWGITCATTAHLRVYRKFGVPRVLMANQVLDTDSIRLVARELAADPGFEFYGIVDSVEGARRYRDGLAAADAGHARAGGAALSRPINLLLEVGAPGGRTGARSAGEAVRVAREITGLGGLLRLVGVEAFEGIFPGSPRESEVAVDTFLKHVAQVAQTCDDDGLFRGDSIVLTAGGSAHFDQVVKALRALHLSLPTTLVLRSGCYITHDHGTYAAALQRLRERSHGSLFGNRTFEPALELWTTVQSLPEPGLAILTLGKRDVSFDMGLPVPIKHLRHGSGTDPVPVRGKAEIVRLNDHHGYMRFADLELAVQDRIAVGISHPCTTFDRWEFLYLVDDRYDVLSVLQTFF